MRTFLGWLLTAGLLLVGWDALLLRAEAANGGRDNGTMNMMEGTNGGQDTPPPGGGG